MNSYTNNKYKQLASCVGNNSFVVKSGFIQSFNPDDWTITVFFPESFEDDDTQAGAVNIPLSSQWLGNGWGLYCAPQEGTEVVITFRDANLQDPVSIAYCFNNQFLPIQGIQSQECWLVHSSGSLIRLTNDGKISINGNTEVDMTTPILNITTTGAININAGTIATIQAATSIDLDAPIINVSNDLNITNNLIANNGETTMEDGIFTTNTLIAQNKVEAAGISLTDHVHGGVQSGSSETDPPSG